MKIRASVDSAPGQHRAVVGTEGRDHELPIAGNATGGSRTSGGELLFLALATCYCDDLYREAARRGIRVERVTVEVEGSFAGPGDIARDIVYRVDVTADASEEDVAALIWHTDTVAEIQNTLRAGVRVELVRATRV